MHKIFIIQVQKLNTIVELSSFHNAPIHMNAIAING